MLPFFVKEGKLTIAADDRFDLRGEFTDSLEKVFNQFIPGPKRRFARLSFVCVCEREIPPSAVCDSELRISDCFS